jgi:hypothetical protein
VQQYLAQAAAVKSLDDINTLGDIIYQRYMLFVTLLNRQPPQQRLRKPLIPPLDVEVVWFTHMLQSDEYEAFAKRVNIEGEPHTWTLLMSNDKRNALVKESA